jgi:tetratricopeptide (TPR) repeat protein
MANLCGDDELMALVRDMQSPQGQQDDHLGRIDQLLAAFTEDPRLHFMRGSMLIGKGRLIEAHRALSRAVAIAPDFAIARFQLGFFQLTSGEAENALESWGRLDRLPDAHYLRKFVDGLRCLIRDDFLGAIDNLRAGILLNEENPPLSRDMQLIIDQCRPLLARSTEDGADMASETSLILQQFNRHSSDN